MNDTEMQRRADFLIQRDFLRSLALTVEAFNSTPGAKIDMHWLIDDLNDAADEAEQEANA